MKKKEDIQGLASVDQTSEDKLKAEVSLECSEQTFNAVVDKTF